MTLHERFGALPPPPDMFEERQRDVEVERVRKRSTTSFAITMNEFPNPEKQHRLSSSERFGRIQSVTTPAGGSFDPPASRSSYEEQEVSFQQQSLQEFHRHDEDSQMYHNQYMYSREQQFHSIEPPPRVSPDNISFQSNPRIRLDPEQTIYQNPNMLKNFMHAMQGVRGVNGRPLDNQDNMREGYEFDDYGPGRRDPAGEFDLLAMGEPTNQPWQLRQSGIAGLDKDVVGPGRTFGGRGGVRDMRGLKGKDQRDGRDPLLYPMSNMPPRPPQLRQMAGPGPAPFNGMSLRSGPMNNMGNPMRPQDMRFGPMDMNDMQQRLMPPGSLQGPMRPMNGMGGPLRPMGNGPQGRMLPMGNSMQGNPRLMGMQMGGQQLPMGGPQQMPMGGPQQLQRIFPMGGPQFRPPPGSALRLQGIAPRPSMMPQPKALVPPGGWAHLPSKVVGAHAPRGVGGPRRTKPGRMSSLEPKSDLDADLDQYRSEGIKGTTELSEQNTGDPRSESDEIEAPAEEDLGDIGVLE